MRKLVLVIAVILLTGLLASTVWASMWGTYMGYVVARLQVNGQVVTPSSPAIIIDGRTYVPLRFVGEALGAKVSWDENNYTVVIESGAAASPKIPAANEYVVKDDNGKALYSFKINKVTSMSERNPYSDKKPAQVIMIDYTYTNIASDKNVFLGDSYFKVVDSAGNIGYTYPNTPKYYPQSIPTGATCHAQMIFGLDAKSDVVKIYFYRNIFDDTATATFEMPVE